MQSVLSHRVKTDTLTTVMTEPDLNSSLWKSESGSLPLLRSLQTIRSSWVYFLLGEARETGPVIALDFVNLENLENQDVPLVLGDGDT